MQLYDFRGGAPSPRKVRIYLAEKGLEVPRVEVDIHRGESRTPGFKRKNPLGNVPVLELDDGTCISDSLAICRYFEALHPDPPLFGTGALEQAQIEMWIRRIELNFYLPIDLGGAFDQLGSDAGPRFRKGATWFMGFLDRELREREFVAGVRYTAADVLAYCALDYGIAHVRYAVGDDQPHLGRWYRAMAARPSARA